MATKREKTFALFENLGANIKYYITQFNGVKEEVPGAKEILSKLAVLEESFDNSGRKYLRDSNVKISKDSYNQLLSGMSSLFSEINKFTSEDIKGTIGRDNKSIVFQFMAKECGAVLSDSFEKLSNVKYDETKLLEDNIGLSRKTIRVDLSKEKGFSGALNCWIPVKFTDRDGTVKEGFFNKNALGEGIRDAFDENGNPIASMPINYEVRPGYMNKRNELATEFAEDLKLDYIAKAESVLIEDSAGNMVEGTFMETAKGSDTKHLDPNDPLLKCKNIAACSNPKFLKQIADIQVYDYLMDNFDRSEANVMYNVDYDSKGDPYIASVKCIDHDSTYFSAKNQGSQSYMAGPEDMRAISEHMAIKVMEIDPVSYRLKMASKGLTKPQMDAAFERLEVMKTQIRLAQTEPEKAAFKILSDDEFAKYTIKDFNDPSKFKFKNVTGSLKDCSMFNRVYNIARNDVTWPSPEGKHIDYCQGTLNDNEPKVSKEALMEYKIDLLKGLKELAAPEGHKRLTEYKAMKMGCTFAVAAIDQALQNASATGSDIISEGDKNKINRALKGLSEATNSFMYKSGSFTMAKDAIGMPIADATMSRYRKFAGMAKDVKDVALNYGKNDPGLNISREDKKQEYYRDVYNRLRECSNAFKANEAWHVKSSDDYMTLRKIVKACVEEPTWNKDRFSKEDMERFDKMFDQVKKASKIYYDKKVVRENKKQTARGQNRMKAVEKLIGQETVLENENKGFTL